MPQKPDYHTIGLIKARFLTFIMFYIVMLRINETAWKKIESMIVHYNHFECYIASSECHGEIVVANANYSNVFDHALEIGLENRRLHFSRCLLLHYRAHYSRILKILFKNDGV